MFRVFWIWFKKSLLTSPTYFWILFRTQLKPLYKVLRFWPASAEIHLSCSHATDQSGVVVCFFLPSFLALSCMGASLWQQSSIKLKIFPFIYSFLKIFKIMKQWWILNNLFNAFIEIYSSSIWIIGINPSFPDVLSFLVFFWVDLLTFVRYLDVCMNDEYSTIIFFPCDVLVGFRF